MTCGVEFISSDQTRPIAKYNRYICYSNFDYKILLEEPLEIIETIWFNIVEGVDTSTSDKQFIEKIWQASIEYDYIPAEYDMLLMFVEVLHKF